MIVYYDEAGRGPLAGPVYIGLTLLTKNIKKRLFKDSKKLSEKQRNLLYKKIKSDKDIITITACSSNIVIDSKGIIFAIRQSIFKGLWKLLNIIINENKIIFKNNYSQKNLKILLKQYKNIELVLDGNTDFGIGNKLGIKTTTIIKGDDKIQGISISSIIAKVERDEYMKKTSKKDFFKQYGFEKHKGYGTRLHIQNIQKYGLSKIHRKTYCKSFLNKIT